MVRVLDDLLLYTINWVLRWLDTVFQGQYLPSLSINYFATNTGLEKLPPQLYQIKMKICYDQDCNDIGVVIATKWRYCLFYLQQYCLARPHFSSRPKRFGSRGPCENVGPRQKSSKVRQKWDSSMAMVNKTSVSNFKVKNTSLKHTDEKGIFKRILSFLQVDKGRLFRLYKIVLRGI